MLTNQVICVHFSKHLLIFVSFQFQYRLQNVFGTRWTMRPISFGVWASIALINDMVCDNSMNDYYVCNNELEMYTLVYHLVIITLLESMVIRTEWGYSNRGNCQFGWIGFSVAWVFGSPFCRYGQTTPRIHTGIDRFHPLAIFYITLLLFYRLNSHWFYYYIILYSNIWMHCCVLAMI